MVHENDFLKFIIIYTHSAAALVNHTKTYMQYTI